MTLTSSLLDFALAYASRGWHVLALHSVLSGGACSCGKSDCDSIGKHPRWDRKLLPNGLKSATTDPATIQSWWLRWPDANIGIATGAQSGIWVLDIDCDKGGDLSLEQLLAQHGPLPETPEQKTGSGGTHIIFAHPGVPVGNRVCFAPGLDTRGDGGYIVAAPSENAKGTYEWSVAPDDIATTLAPTWLITLVNPPKQTAAPSFSTNGNGHAVLPKRTLQYIFSGAQKGNRNAELYAAAQQFFAAGYSQTEADQKLRPRAQQDGLTDTEIDRTIASAYQSQTVSTPASVPASAAPQQRKYSTIIAQSLHGLGYTFRLNLCNNTIEVNGESIDDVIAARIRTDARDAGLKPLQAVEDAYTVDAADNAYHPVRDYLSALQWDGQPHIARLAAAFECSDPPVVYADGSSVPLIQVYLWRWLIGGVAKAFRGEQNMMLVIAGPQGIGKSFLARWLCRNLPDHFIEAPINVSDKDTDVRLMSYFLWEVSELDDTTRKADVSALKSFITRGIVTVRKSFGKHDTVKPALANLIGTVNESTGFLSDETGNRRFLVASIAHIDWSYISIDVDQIWAEAVAAYLRGETWKLLDVETARQTEQNKLHETESVLEDWVRQHFTIDPTAYSKRMTAGEIIDTLRSRYEIRLSGSERAQAMELSRIMVRLGIKKVRTTTWRGYEGIMPK